MKPNHRDPTRPGLPARLRWWILHPKAFLFRLVSELYKRRHPGEPWISEKAVRFCEARLNTGMRGLEWGSGRSTAWFARRLGTLLSVEHAVGWYEQVSVRLKEGNVGNVDYRLVPLDHAAQEPAHRDCESLPLYVRVVEEFEEGSLDFVVVDGHYRQACVQAVLPKLKAGGLLLVDNTNWMRISDWGVPAHWQIVHRSMGFESETTIWQRPEPLLHLLPKPVLQDRR